MGKITDIGNEFVKNKQAADTFVKHVDRNATVVDMKQNKSSLVFGRADMQADSVISQKDRLMAADLGTIKDIDKLKADIENNRIDADLLVSKGQTLGKFGVAEKVGEKTKAVPKDLLVSGTRRGIEGFDDLVTDEYGEDAMEGVEYLTGTKMRAGLEQAKDVKGKTSKPFAAVGKVARLPQNMGNLRAVMMEKSGKRKVSRATKKIAGIEGKIKTLEQAGLKGTGSGRALAKQKKNLQKAQRQLGRAQHKFSLAKKIKNKKRPVTWLFDGRSKRAFLKVLACAVPFLLGAFLILMLVMSLSAVLSNNNNKGGNGTGYGELSGNCLEICKYLRGKGVPDMTIAAICGNIYGESGYRPEAVEGNGEGHGICQWSFGRKTALFAYAKGQNKEWSDLDLQLDYLWDEIQGSYKYYFEQVQTKTNVREACTYWEKWFERSAYGAGENRLSEAEYVYEQLRSGGSGDIVELAKSKLGCEYVWGAEGDNTFDCSGLVKWCYDKAGRGGLGHYTVTQYNQCTIISEAEAQAGDIVGWGVGSGCYHVGIYIGDGKCISANGPGGVNCVMESSVHYFNGTVWFGKYGR